MRPPEHAPSLVEPVVVRAAADIDARPVVRLRPVQIPPPMMIHPPTRPPRRGRRRMIVAFCLIALGLMGAAGWIALSLAKRAPSWWGHIDPADPEATRTARTLENGIATLLTKVRSGPGAPTKPGTSGRALPAGKGPPAPDAPLEPLGSESDVWTVVLKASDANAWLATRLRVWLENDSDTPFRWPDAITGVQVRFEGGVISVGASVARPPGPDGRPQPAQVLSASLYPEFRDDGSFWLPARWVNVGQLSLPAGWMLSAASPSGRSVPKDVAALPQTRDLIAAFAGKAPVMRSPIVRIGDGRRVRLLALDVREGKLYITCKTLPRERERAGK